MSTAPPPADIVPPLGRVRDLRVRVVGYDYDHDGTECVVVQVLRADGSPSARDVRHWIGMDAFGANSEAGSTSPSARAVSGLGHRGAIVSPQLPTPDAVRPARGPSTWGAQ